LEVIAKVLKERPEKSLSLLNLSVSKAKTFKECKAKFRFTYIEKLPRKERDYHIFGKFLHEILEKFHKMKIAGDTRLDNKIISEAFKSAYNTFKDKLNEEQLKESKDIISKYLVKLDLDRKLGQESQILDVEKEFYININDKIILNGFIDRIQLDADGLLHVGDYKTSLLLDKKDLSIPFNDTDKYKRYKKDIFQLKTYAYVMLLEHPEIEKIRCSYIMLRHNFHLIEKVFTKTEIMEVGDQFIEYADKIHEEKLFRAQVSPLCPYCDHIDVCDAGKDYVISQDERKNGITAKSFGETNW
jgi:putative RecB family exonuclease